MENAYFPMKTLRITQGYGVGMLSHKHNLALDIAGNDSGIDCAYAPFTGTIKKVYNTENQIWFESKGKVLCADGKERCLVMLLGHDNNISDLKVGQERKQGEKFYDEGTKNATSNHIHMELGEGPYKGTGWFKNSNGVWQINNPLAPEKILWLKKDTVIKNTKVGSKDYMMKIDNEIISAPIPPKFNLTRVLKKGAKGNDVLELKKRLNELGYARFGFILSNNEFGNGTLKAVVQFQKDKKIKNSNPSKSNYSGEVGLNTAHALGWLYNGK